MAHGEAGLFELVLQGNRRIGAEGEVFLPERGRLTVCRGCHIRDGVGERAAHAECGVRGEDGGEAGAIGHGGEGGKLVRGLA